MPFVVFPNVVPPSARGVQPPCRRVLRGGPLVVHALVVGGDELVVVICVCVGGCTMTGGTVGRRWGGRGGERRKSWGGENQCFHDGGWWEVGAESETSAMQGNHLTKKGRSEDADGQRSSPLKILILRASDFLSTQQTHFGSCV